MKHCTLCGETRENVSVLPVAPATWNAFNNFAEVCAECVAAPLNRTRLKAPAAAKPVVVSEETSRHQVTVSHRRTGAVLLVVEGRTLARSTMEGASLNGADLQHADLTGANLLRADLRLADLSGADLRGADLRGATLRGADLRGANLSSAKLNKADLHSARFDQYTGWPADFDARAAGALAE
jgi:uncharacterized protein YjbI with pentapeptide repeats